MDNETCKVIEFRVRVRVRVRVRIRVRVRVRVRVMFSEQVAQTVLPNHRGEYVPRRGGISFCCRQVSHL